MSLRARLLIVTLVVLTAGLAAAGVATHRYLSTFLLDRVDRQLRSAPPFAARALELATAFGEPPGNLDAPLGMYVAFVDASGMVVVSRSFGFETSSPPALPSELTDVAASEDGSRGPLTISSVDGSVGYRALALRARRVGGGQVTEGALVIAVSLAETERTLDRLVVTEIVVGAAVLLAAWALALWLVRVGLRPLEGIAQTAGAIAAGDLSRRVEPATERTEVGRLGIALNSMLGQIEEAFDERRASEERLRRFVGDASHELRTPLTSIRGYAELFRLGADARPEDLAKAMQRIESEAARMGVLVDDLLLLARLDQGRPLESERVELATIVQEAVDSARTVDPGRPLDLRVEGETSVVGDSLRLRQVIDNLLSNVRDHTPPGAPAEVELRGGDDHVLLVVADRGPGLGGEDSTRVFERFYRGDPARSRVSGGAGLGLSIATAIVEAHGGRISVSARVDGGAAFEVRLPRPGPGPGDGDAGATQGA